MLHDGKVNSIRYKDEFGNSIWMSHEILKRRGIIFTDQVDHKDRNPLNNQFENLRPATASQNLANRGKYKTNTSGYKGVSYNKQKALYQVRVQRNHIGYFINVMDAARAYDRAAKRIFGEFAALNFVGA